MEPHAVVARAAAASGCVRLGDLAAAGVAPRVVTDRLRSGEWRMVLGDVVHLGCDTPSLAARIEAVRRVAPAHRFVGDLAAAAWGLIPYSAVREVVAEVPRSRAAERGDGVRLVRADVTPEQLASAPLRDRLPVPPEGEALRGVAAACPSADVDELVEGFLRRRRGDATELLTACGRGRAGSTAVRAALRRVHDGHWSGGERALARELRRLGAPPLQANVPVTRPSTGETAVLDLYAPSRRRAVEVDGWAYHVDRIRFASDRRRDRWLETECGIAVLRVAGADVHHSLGPTAQEVKAWLLA